MNTMKMNFALALALLGAASLARAGEPAAAAATPAAAPGTATAAAATNNGPTIVFDNPIYDFGKVSAGDPVKHTFIFTNTGDALLELANVQPSCGCTTAGEWSRKVEPGKTGSIPVQFNSGSYNGGVTKFVTVTCNDKAHASVQLQLKGTIWKPLEANPQFVMINVPADTETNMTATVHIVNNTETPVTLSPPESNNKSFNAELVTNTPGKDFTLNVSTTGALNAGSIQGQINIKTSMTNVPVLTITTWANVAAAVTFSPPQVSLAPAPLAAKASPVITVQNNGKGHLTLSDAEVSAKGVDFQIKEEVAANRYVVTLNFPEGYEIAPGERVEFSVKTSHPQFPLIKVPVIQPPRPAPVTPVAVPGATAPVAPRASGQ